MTVKINRKLNIVVPMEDDTGRTYYLHSIPMSREAFKENWLLLSQTFSIMVEQGIQVTAGPRVAAMVMKDLADKQGREDDYKAVIAEVKRLTTVIKPTENGYEQIPLSTAMIRGVVSTDDVDDAENMLVFFMLVSAMWKGDRLDASLRLMNGLWQSQNTSLNATEFTASLQTSTEAESSGEKKPE